MQFINRLIYAFFFTVLLAGCSMVIEMIFSLGLGDFIFSEWFFVPVFVFCYLITPYVSKRIRLD